MGRIHANVVIIGAGISGLSCAKRLMGSGIDFLILEAGQRIGGRIKSDQVAGFILDHGFQVLQTAYPEARRQLDYGKLKLKPFSSGVAVRMNGEFFYISDPIRRPKALWGTLRAPIGTFADRLRMLTLFVENQIKGHDGIFESQDIPTIEFLKSYHFSDRVIDRFFRPFFAGACLDPDIMASSRVFRYLFSVFASGDAALPSNGMGEIPAQLMAGLPRGKVHLGKKVHSIDHGGALLTDGTRISGQKIVLATQEPETRRLLNRPAASFSLGERCLYFSAECPPINQPFLILDGEKNGLINNVAIPTLTAPSYSSSGNHLIAAVVLGHEGMTDNELEPSVRGELANWFGDAVRGWKHIKTYHIDHALPDQSPPVSNPLKGGTKIGENLYVCGEYQSVPGIQWALHSGRRTAEQIIRDTKAG